MSSNDTKDHNDQHGSMQTKLEAGLIVSADVRRLHGVYRSLEQERINYLEARLVGVMTEVESLKTDNERLTVALDERDDQLSECRTELIQAYKTSMLIRADMLELLQKLQQFDLEEEGRQTQRAEGEAL